LGLEAEKYNAIYSLSSIGKECEKFGFSLPKLINKNKGFFEIEHLRKQLSELKDLQNNLKQHYHN
jgi:hypothetical protein